MSNYYSSGVMVFRQQVINKEMKEMKEMCVGRGWQ
jgi:hypothetical protein